VTKITGDAITIETRLEPKKMTLFLPFECGEKRENQKISTFSDTSQTPTLVEILERHNPHYMPS
jgi:hypothetical protein